MANQRLMFIDEIAKLRQIITKVQKGYIHFIFLWFEDEANKQPDINRTLYGDFELLQIKESTIIWTP